MKNEILLGGIKFWVDQNVIHCKIYKSFNVTSRGKDTEEIFFNAITILSNGKCMPLLINMCEIDYSLSIKTFKYISANSLIKTAVLSKTFLVNSFLLKIYLGIYNFIGDPLVPNAIFKDFNSAIFYCNEKASEF